MASKFIEGHIREYETALELIRDLITDRGETTTAVQQEIDHALDKLSEWYEMRNMFH